jgi:hypothetical protein
VFLDRTVVKTWARIERGRQTDYSDYPPEKVAFFMRTPTWCRKRASELGPSVTELVAVLLEPNVLHHLRAAQGVLGDPTYRTVKGLLVAGTEHDGEASSSATTAPAHLHGPERLFSFDAEDAS